MHNNTTQPPDTVTPPECSICLEEICDGYHLALDCNHAFHTECLKRWVGHSAKDSLINCPLCRAYYRVERGPLLRRGTGDTSSSDRLEFLPTGAPPPGSRPSRVLGPDPEGAAVESTVSTLTLIKFYRKRQIIMWITGFDIFVGLMRVLAFGHDQAILLDCMMQIACSAYGFFGAIGLRSCYLLIYFGICINSTMLRGVALFAYMQDNVLGPAASGGGNRTHGNTTDITGPRHGDAPVHVLFIVAILWLSFLVQAWIAYITIRLRADVIRFRELFRHRLFLRVAP